MTLLRDYRSYHFGAEFEMSEVQMDALIAQFQHPEVHSEGVLNGRSTAPVLHLDDIGPVVVKHYIRGGFLRNFNRRTYLKIGMPRCRIEYEMLLTLQHAGGVLVPQPVAYAFCGSILYHAWLITRLVPDVYSLAALSIGDSDRALKILPTVISSVNTLIDIGVLHVDLHPGNVLVDDHDNVFLIDFDKAKTKQLDKDGLRRRYTERWQRAVAKHGLPKKLATEFILA